MTSSRQVAPRGHDLRANLGGLYESMRWCYVPALTLLLFSYPLTTVWLLAAGVPTGPANFAIKGGIAVLFGTSLLRSLLDRRHFPLTFIPLCFFYTLYGIRLIDDIFNKDIIPVSSSPSYIILYFFGLTFMPALAVGLGFRRDDIKSLHRWMFYILVLSNISLVYYMLFVGDVVAEDAFSGRFEVAGSVTGTAVLNPITVGFAGALLCLFTIGRLAAFKEMSRSAQALHVAVFTVGIANLLSGGSRSSIVALVAGLLLLFASMSAAAFGKGALRINPRILFFLAAISTSLFFLAASKGVSIGVFDRFKNMFDPSGNRILEQRDYIYSSAWNDFVTSPFTGSSYLTMNGFTFPHNSLLEALMAVGVFGGLAIIYCYWMSVRGSWRALLGYASPYAYSIGLAAVALMMLSMTSGSIATSPDIWGMVALSICIGRIRPNHQRPVGPPRFAIRGAYRGKVG